MNLGRARSFFDTVDSRAKVRGNQTVPHHIAFTMDGNRRWARANGIPALRGHREGALALRRTIDAAINENVPWLTFYAFSTENWNRAPDEVDALMGLARNFSGEHLEELHCKGAHVRVLGERHGLDAKLIESIEEAEALTKDNDVVHINLAFNYSGSYDLTRAAKQIARNGKMPKFVEKHYNRQHEQKGQDVSGTRGEKPEKTSEHFHFCLPKLHFESPVSSGLPA